MDDLSAHMKSVLRVGSFTLALLLVLWALFPSVRPYAAGLMVGSVAGLFNTYFLAKKVEQLTKLVIEQKGKRMYMGYATRICVAILAVMLAVKQPQIDLAATLIGLVCAQMITLFMGFVAILRKKL